MSSNPHNFNNDAILPGEGAVPQQLGYDGLVQLLQQNTEALRNRDQPQPQVDDLHMKVETTAKHWSENNLIETEIYVKSHEALSAIEIGLIVLILCGNFTVLLLSCTSSFLCVPQNRSALKYIKRVAFVASSIDVFLLVIWLLVILVNSWKKTPSQLKQAVSSSKTAAELRLAATKFLADLETSGTILNRGTLVMINFLTTKITSPVVEASYNVKDIQNEFDDLFKRLSKSEKHLKNTVMRTALNNKIYVGGLVLGITLVSIAIFAVSLETNACQ